MIGVKHAFWAPAFTLAPPPHPEPKKSQGKERNPAATQVLRLGYLRRHDRRSSGDDHYVLNVRVGESKWQIPHFTHDLVISTHRRNLSSLLWLGGGQRDLNEI